MKYTGDLIEIKERIDKDVLSFDLVFKAELGSNMLWRVEILGDGPNPFFKRWDYSKDTTFKWKFPKSGIFCILVILKDQDTFYYPLRKSIKYYDKEIVSGYKSFLESNIEMDQNPIPIYNPPYPWQNLTLIYSTNTKYIELIKDFARIHSELKCASLRQMECAMVLSQFEQFDNRIFFSGRTKHNKKLLIGQNDLTLDTNYHTLLDEVGTWSAIYYNSKEIIITNDYFGMYKLFYYHSNDIHVVSNNYHTMLLLLKSVGEKLELNIEETLPYLLKAQNGLLEQRISMNMDVHNIIALPVHQYIRIDETGVNILNKSIYDVIIQDEEYNETQYQQMLTESAKEIKENIEIVLKDDRFDKILVDLTGGKDSRTVFAALNALNNETNGEFREKIYIQMYGNKGDAKTAFNLNCIFNYKFDYLPRKIKLGSVLEKEMRNRSFFLGTSFSRHAPIARIFINEDSKTINITGAGEVCLRPYYSREGLGLHDYFLKESKEEITIDNTIETLKNSYYDTWRVLTDNEFAKNAFKTILKKNISLSPSNQTISKIDDVLLYYRNVYHFGMQAIMDSIEKPFQWQPLYSKQAYKTFRYIYRINSSIKFQMDLIAVLCPILAILPFESKQDNIDVEQIIDDLVLDSCYKKMKIPFENDLDKFESYYSKKQAINHTIANDDSAAIQKQNNTYWSTFFSRFLSKLHRLIKFNSEVYGDLGLDLYAYVLRQKEKYEGKYVPPSTQFLFNKICSIVDQIDIIEQSGRNNNE